MSAASTVPPKVAHLRTLPAIRERCSKVFELAQKDQLDYFTYDGSKMNDVIQFCHSIIKRDFGSNLSSIPGHSRWRHFDATSSPPQTLPRITTLLSRFASSQPPVSALEASRRLVDLFIVSVLLDAGAGTRWSYEERNTGMRLGRSEGLAVASLDMFVSGGFKGDDQDEADGDGGYKVDAAGLKRISPDTIAMAMQVHPDSNPMEGLEGRAALLTRLGSALEADENSFFVGPPESKSGKGDKSKRRPGYLVDYLASHPTTTKTKSSNGEEEVQVQVSTLWEALIYGLAPIWPSSRTNLEGVALGDVWPLPSLAKSLSVDSSSPEALVPFHKLSQWMCYSIIEPIEQTLGWKFVGGESQTGLPEYRNGGLFVDLGVLMPKSSLLEASDPPVSSLEEIPRLEPSHPAVVEWRALTVILLDNTAKGMRELYGLDEEQLSLKQVLEAATWKGGREIAKTKRPQTGGPPINIISDGTVF